MTDGPEIKITGDVEALDLTLQLVFQTKRRAEILAAIFHKDEEVERQYLEEFEPDIRELGENIVVNLALQGLLENDPLYGKDAIKNTFELHGGHHPLKNVLRRLFSLGVNYGSPENSLNHPQISFREDVIKFRTLAKFFERAGSMEDLQKRFVLNLAKDALFHLDDVPKSLIMVLDKDGRTEIEDCKNQLKEYDKVIEGILEQSDSNIFAARFKRQLTRGQIDVELLKKLTIHAGTQGLALLLTGIVESTDQLTAVPEGFEPENGYLDYEEELKKFLKQYPNPKTVAAQLLRTEPLA